MSTTTTHMVAPSLPTPQTIHLRPPTPNMSTTPEVTAVAPPNAPDNAHDCKSCGRTMAVISAEGEMLPQGEMDEGCELCKDFMFYFNELREWKEEFKEVEHRRDNFQPRKRILRAIHQTKVLLGNFIQMVAAWDKEDDGKEDFSGEIEFLRKQREGIMAGCEDESVEGKDNGKAGDLPDKESKDLSDKHPEGAVKKQPTQPTPSHLPNNPPATPPPTLKRSPSLHSSPGPRKLTKRPRLSDTRTRRISFDSSVVFRDIESNSRRVDAEFSRGSSEYSPGRWAAPEGSQWLDTSGYGATIAKFTGAMKRGEKWVATKEGQLLDEEWEEWEEGEEGGGGEQAEAITTLDSKPDAGGEKAAPDAELSAGAVRDDVKSG